MKRLLARMRAQFVQWLAFVKWLLYACLTGLTVGLVVSVFSMSIDAAVVLRAAHPNIVWLLPPVGLGIAALYRLCNMENDRGANLVMMALRGEEEMKLRTVPLIFISALGTHLAGGSAGRMGASLQMGGSLSACMGRVLPLDEKDRRILVMCGVSAAFSALFGTPLAAAVFAMEVASVGVMYYAAIVPCLVSSFTAGLLARALGLHAVHGYTVDRALGLAEALPVLQTAALGVLCALVSILFCIMMRTMPRLYRKYLRSPLLRTAAGGAIVLALTLLVGDQTYNGAGDAVSRRLLAGDPMPEAFALKILFTALTIGAGFKGGEITPALFTGCAFGTWVGPLLGLPHSFAGALGMAAVFCGVTNCPISSVLLAFELFGGDGLPLYALCCAVSYMLSGYYGLFTEQEILYSKFRTERIDRKAK